MKLTKITAAAVAALTIGGTVASTGVAFADDVPVHISGNDATIGQKFFTPDKSKQAALADIVAKSDTSADTDNLSLFRMYNPTTGEHFYTVSSYEAASLLINNNWNYEGTLGETLKSGNTAVTRLYNKTAGVHYYTSSEFEARALMAKGWTDEGVAFIDGGEVDIYAAYNANTSQHNYTSFLAEENSLLAAGWQAAGGMGNVAFHLDALGTSFPAAAAGYSGTNNGVAYNGTVFGSQSVAGTASTGTGATNTVVGANGNNN